MSWPEFVYPWFDQLSRFKTLVTLRGYPLHRSEGYRPFFVVGSGRCGTTLLRRILQASPQVHIPPETYMIGPAIKFFRHNRDKLWGHLVRSVLSMFEFNKEFDRFGISLRPLMHDLLDAPKEDRSLALILDSLFRYHGNQTGQTFTRWGDKTPLNSYCLDAILAVFPDACFVHLIRDGVDVVYSLCDANLVNDLQCGAKRWKTAIAAVDAFSRKHPTRCIEMRYEAMVKDPQTAIERVCNFLEIPFDRLMLETEGHPDEMKDLTTYLHHTNVLNPIDSVSIGKGRRELSREDKQKLHRLIGSELERLGYEPVA